MTTMDTLLDPYILGSALLVVVIVIAAVHDIRYVRRREARAKAARLNARPLGPVNEDLERLLETSHGADFERIQLVKTGHGLMTDEDSASDWPLRLVK